MRKVFITVAAMLFGGLTLSAQEIRVISGPDTSAIVIGDQTGFTVTADIPAGVTATLSGAADSLAGKIVILRRDPRDTSVSADGSMKIIDRYLITSFDSGSYAIPPFYAEVASGDSLMRYFSDYSFLDVVRPEVAPQDTTDVIFDIIPPRGAPVTFREVLPWIVIALIAAVIVWLLARFLPRNPLRRFVRPPAPPEPAHIVALRDLQALRDAELWQKGEIKEYYSRLSDILRRYIDGRYGISSPELTTDETVRMLQKAAVTTPGQMAMVKELLSVSDMVKFAKYLPDSAVHVAFLDNAVRFVEETRLPDAVPAEGNLEAAADQGVVTGKTKTGKGKKGGRHA
jgi:hypothetical protein